MSWILDLIQLEEFVPLVVLICLILFIVNKFTQPDTTSLRLSRWIAMWVFCLYAAIGIYALVPAGAGELLVIAVRGCLASAMSFAISLLVISSAMAIFGDPLGRVKGWYRRISADAENRTRLRKEEQHRWEKECRNQLEESQRRQQWELQQRRIEQEQAVKDRQRLSAVEEAVQEVQRYYDQHAHDLDETMPRSLLRSKLQTSFPEGISGQTAWQSAQTLITEMLPIIAQASEKRRTQEQRRLESDVEIQRKQQEIQRAQQELQSLLDAPGYEPDVCEPEVRAIKQQIRERQQELSELEVNLTEFLS
ncbi:hypothetical protein GC176_18360 [bacterium]|nr:hypothetical protein [bacterium]